MKILVNLLLKLAAPAPASTTTVVIVDQLPILQLNIGEAQAGELSASRSTFVYLFLLTSEVSREPY